MTFCTFCGRQLADGEVCNCQQNAAPQNNIPQGMPYGQPQPAPQGMPYGQPQPAPQTAKKQSQGDNAIKLVISHITNTIKKPLTAAEEYYEKGTVASSGILVGLIAVVYVISQLLYLVTRIIYRLAYYKKSVKSSGILALNGISYSDYLKLNGITRWDILKDVGYRGYTFVQAVFFPIIYVVLMAAVVIGIYYLVSSVILKEKADIAKAMNLMGATSVPLLGALVFTVINRVFHVGFLNSAFFPIAITCCGFLTLLQGLLIIGKEIKDRKKLLLTLALSVAILMIAHYVIYYLIMRHCIVYMSFPM